MAGVAEALIKVTRRDPHWGESAQGLLAALVMWELRRAYDEKREPALENVRRYLTEADEYVTIRDENGNDIKDLIKGFSLTTIHMAASTNYMMASLAERFMGSTNELASIRSTADTQTRWLLSKPMRDDLRRDEPIDFASLKTADKPTTVYVILPAERLRTHSVWLRLVIVTALRSLYRPGGRRTLFLIDELAALDRLAPLEDAFGLVRGYNVQIAGILQDLSQLQDLYRDRWASFIANSGVVMGFAPNDPTTANWMSERAGVETFLQESISDGGATGPSLNRQQASRKLFLPQDLMALDAGAGLLWIAGMPNTGAFFAPQWWNVKMFEQRGLKSPYHS